ncbi:MarR family transcriptional regulator [Alteribacillus sp. YIM 98480]|uniref:transcriptional regulator, SarA/Rot family n=1 Tax=Alteribacillus sp. YIM 98480 TaxID=2606599 RepID=UPI00131D9ED7|nr:MarR family transcriptional regulator [Alteribacillus sp. YIM 98480]
MEDQHLNYHSYLNLLRGALKVVEEDWQSAANDLGITQAEQHILWILFMEKKATMSKIAELGLWDLSTVMQIIKRLKSKQLVKIEKNENDLRVSYVTLTEKGEEIRKASSEKTHRFLQFIEEYGRSNQDFLKHFHLFLQAANSRFHGENFVRWVEKTSDFSKQ